MSCRVAAGCARSDSAIADEGRGSGAGVRVIYLHVPEAKRFYLIDVYGKDKQDDIAAADKKILGRLAMEIEAAAIAQYKEWEEETNHDEAS